MTGCRTPSASAAFCASTRRFAASASLVISLSPASPTCPSVTRQYQMSQPSAAHLDTVPPTLNSPSSGCAITISTRFGAFSAVGDVSVIVVALLYLSRLRRIVRAHFVFGLPCGAELRQSRQPTRQQRLVRRIVEPAAHA